MSLAEKFIKDFEELSEERQKEVIDFVGYLKNKEEKNIDTIINDVINENAKAFEELAK